MVYKERIYCRWISHAAFKSSRISHLQLNKILGSSLLGRWSPMTKLNPLHPPRLDVLDFLRAVAALTVVIGHTRTLVFYGFQELVDGGIPVGLIAKVMYFVTSFGHQAVLVFFVLSGFLVGGKAFTDLIEGKFSWRKYTLRRLSRLWIVLIPALLATAAFDYAGMWISGGAGYDGSYHALYNVLPSEERPISLSWLTFLGNIGFVQTIFVATYGTNGPLWSLANEFWYYFIFPLVGWIFLANSRILTKIIALIALFAILFILPLQILTLGLLWMMGAAASLIAFRSKISSWFTSLQVRILALGLAGLILMASKIVNGTAGDLIIGGAFALVLPVLALMPSPGKWFVRLARAGSEISYTLYLTHLPLLVFLTLSFLAPMRFYPDISGYSVFSAFVVVSVLWATIMWWLFERHTNRLYELMSGLRAYGVAKKAGKISS